MVGCLVGISESLLLPAVQFYCTRCYRSPSHRERWAADSPCRSTSHNPMSSRRNIARVYRFCRNQRISPAPRDRDGVSYPFAHRHRQRGTPIQLTLIIYCNFIIKFFPELLHASIHMCNTGQQHTRRYLLFISTITIFLDKIN